MVVLRFVVYDGEISKFLHDYVVKEFESRLVQLRIDERRDDDEARMTEGLQEVDELQDVCFDGEVSIITAAVYDDMFEFPDLCCSLHES